MSYKYMCYSTIFSFFLFSAILPIMLVLLTTFLSYKSTSKIKKFSPYECGFEPFSDSRDLFEIHFYMVALLFLLFDIEVLVIFPWAIRLRQLGSLGIWSMIFFLIFLIVGFIYEWKKGALRWRSYFF